MFGVGFVEICIIAIAALIFIGPKKFPDLMRQAGRFFVQMRRMSNEIKSGWDEVVQEAEKDMRAETRPPKHPGAQVHLPPPPLSQPVEPQSKPAQEASPPEEK